MAGEKRLSDTLFDTTEYLNPAGNQVFITLRKGTEYPPKCCDVRMKYGETVKTLKEKVSNKLLVPVDKIQLFWARKEMRADRFDHLTMEKLKVHTGFHFSGYDLTAPPDYFPPCVLTENGLYEKAPITNQDYIDKHPGCLDDPDVLNIVPGVPVKQDPKDLERVVVIPQREPPVCIL